MLEVGGWRRQSQVARGSTFPKWGDTFHLEGGAMSRGNAVLRLQVKGTPRMAVCLLYQAPAPALPKACSGPVAYAGLGVL